ncbi:hypothetical protein Ndes2526A_g07171 [Nannochloris sp. 'desiccata']
MTSSPAGPTNGTTKGAPSNGTNSKSRLEMATKYRSALGLSSSMSYDNMNMARESSGAMPLGVPKRSMEISASLEDQVRIWGGDRPIHSVLVANNGLAAVKFIRSVRSWAYKCFGDERAVNIIAMASPEDMKADAEHIRMADQFVEVPGGRNVNNYANVQLIVSIANRTGVDAVWPGWGHASEKPELPDLLSKTPTKIRFIGPPAHAMSALGDKIGSTILAQSAGVPTLPWSGDGVTVDWEQCNKGVLPDDIYDKACIHSLEEALQCCNRIGYPAMLKASWGGGGKGIRKVMNDDEVRLVFRQVQGEVPGSPIFAMKLAPQSRHLEVQLLADMHGNVCSLFSRDCSVQRRHQKIVEEGPVTAAPAHIKEHMESCARALARSVGYVGAATIEYLYAMESGEYCFLELNPRLQVEHPVTEWISGVNIPSAQLLIAQGVPLHAIPDIRRLWGRDIEGKDTIDFDNTAARLPPAGHVVAVRITAENANAGFKPTSGGVDEISFRSTPEVWGYFSVKNGGAIHEYSDSQFGHLFAKGENRTAALRAMVVALKEIRIRGEIRTNSDYVCDLIQCREFVEDEHHTSWLDSRIAAQITSGRPPWHLSVVCGAMVRAFEHSNSRLAEYLGYLQKGQLPPARISLVTTTEEFVVDSTKYTVRVVRTGQQTATLHLGNSTVDVVSRKLNDGGLLIQLDGSSYVVHTEEEPLGTRLSIGTHTCLLSNEHDPSKMNSLSTGKLVRYLVEDGGHVEADEPYAEIEVMKMVMTFLAPASGRVRFQLPEGSVLAPGQLIARLDLDDPAAVRRAQPFTGTWPELGPPVVAPDGIGHLFTAAHEAAVNIMSGYHNDLDTVVRDLLQALDDPSLGLMQWNEAFGVVSSRLPHKLATKLENLAENCAVELEEARLSSSFTTSTTISTNGTTNGPDGTTANVPHIIRRVSTGTECGNIASFCARQMLEEMAHAVDTAPAAERSALVTLLEPLQEVASAHAGGKEEFARRVAKNLLQSYLQIEEQFEYGGKITEQEVIDSLRQAHSSALENVVDVVLSHNGLVLKSQLILRIMGALVLPAPDVYRPLLRRLAALAEPGTSGVALRAQQLLEHSLLGELRAMVARTLSGLDMFVQTTADGGSSVATGGAGPVARKSSSRNSVDRRLTVKEGLYAGLANLESPLMNAAGVEERMAMLVEAPAAVEDALASLLDDDDEVVRQRALITYIKRIYFPFLLHEPALAVAPSNAKGGASLTAVWAYSDAATAGTALARDCLGGAVLINSLADLPAAMKALENARSQTGLAGVLDKGTLHVVLTGQGETAFHLTQEAYALLKEVNVDGYAPSDCEDSRNTSVDPKAVAAAASAQIRSMASQVFSSGYSAVSVMSKRGQLMPLRTVLYYSEETRNFELIPVLSLTEPPTAAALELCKLTGFPNATYSSSRNLQWHIYTITERDRPSAPALKRVFLRGVVRQLGRPDLLAATYSSNAAGAASAAMEEVDLTLEGALDELERIGNTAAAGLMTAARPDWSHIYLDVLTPLPLGADQDESRVAAALRAAAASITAKCSAQLRRAAIAQWEVKLRVSDKAGSAWHVIVSVPTGHEGGEDCVDLYREQPASDGSGLVYISKDSFALGRTSAASHVGSLDGTFISAPYPPLERLQQKRLAARRHKTTYCYDFPAVFENALREIWAARAAAGEPNAVPPAARLVEVQELVPAAGETLSFRQKTALVPSTRPMSQNSVGVVAWVLTLRTPECPQGRQIVAIANDITHASGAFGPAEDAMFRAATEFALEQKLPVVYLAANSGARVGLANEVKQCLQVEWTNPAEPSKGFKYLYLSSEDYNCISKRAAAAGSGPALLARKIITDAGEERYEITDIVGLEDGLGVECLSGSGAIASIYAKAFREGFTVTLVSGRTVGIGAYLARLGRRCVQREDQPIILTGYAALNKLLGRDVYTSHMQLGGPKVMGQNGVSHHIVEDDLAGVMCVLRWLSYTAARVGEAPPRLPTSDPDTRPVTYLVEEGTKLDPRAAIAGRLSVSAPGGWESGMFDRGSWTEAHPGWARTVVTGRARLAGQPVGVIAVEVSTISLNLPADPGMPDSSERIVPQAGQVWFPDSALKTAQAMEEFDLEKLPFLRTYGQPVVMYIPPGCELRGGAWVVIDSQINCEQIESYADPTAKGAVLEPDGVVEIKFRPAELLTIMHRIDPVILKLKQEGAGPGDAAIKSREAALMPVYHQVALAFAQMHDTPQRMMAKGVLRGVVPWMESRAFFSARLRRRMAEEALLRHIKAADSEVSRENAVFMLRSWFNSSFSAGNVVVPDRKSKSEEAIAHVQLAAASAAVANITSSSTISSSNSSSTSSLGEKEMAWESDGAFMSWVESASGAARIAIELKALKQRAASAVVAELAATAEGTDGLIRGLAEAVRSNPSLVLQLRSLVNK